MRILHVIPSVASVHGGPSRAITLIEQSLVNQNVVVETATTDDDGPGKRLGHEIAARHESLAGTSRWFFPKQTDFYKVSFPLGRWISKNLERFDLVHIHSLFSHTSITAARRARRAGVPYIVRPLGVLNQYGLQHRRALLKRLSLPLIEAPILKHAAAVHFTDDAERLDVEELGLPLRSVVVPLGIPELIQGSQKRFLQRHSEFQGRKMILFLSRVDPKKGIESLLLAVEILKKEFGNGFRLAIAGDGKSDYIGKLKKLSLSLGITNLVTWLGQIEGDEKSDAYAAADIYVLPSYSENFGIALVEAMSSGIACVTSPGVAISSSVVNAEAGLVVNSDGPALAGAVKRLLKKESLRDRFANNGRDLVRREFSLDVMGYRLKSLYETLLKDQNQTPRF
ncbi:MAG: glycosyltransferase [Gammaproteobacteria bacterium]|nr:glycosyltransferase [Gammaproteobacteria bacterium]